MYRLNLLNGYLFDHEARTFSFLLSHLFGFDSRCEFVAERDLGLGRTGIKNGWKSEIGYKKIRKHNSSLRKNLQIPVQCHPVGCQKKRLARWGIRWPAGWQPLVGWSIRSHRTGLRQPWGLLWWWRGGHALRSQNRDSSRFWGEAQPEAGTEYAAWCWLFACL